ncbi:MAG: ComEC family competence protein [Elusimicrobia bacterium]|nr:ComEC family competence protein [Elusimicrobiota bacterium]
MRAEAFLRPLAWGLAVYAALLSGLWQLGVFRVHAPPALAAKARAETTALSGTLLSGVTPKRPGDRYWLRADEADGAPVSPTKVLVYLARKAEGGSFLRPGQRVRLSGKLRGPARARNPGDFDEAAFLDMRGAALVLHARSVSVLAQPPWRWLPWAWGESVHLAIHRWLARGFGAVEASVLEGLSLGYRGALPAALERDFERSGVVQLLTPSADKLTLPMGGAFVLGLAFGLGPGARALLVLAVGALQLLIVIPDPSHTRPYLMAASALAARRLGREPGLFQVWVLAAWATLLCDPRQLFNAGFVLTYGALLPIIAVLPRWTEPLRDLPPALRLVGTGLALQCVLQAALTPAFASYFGTISLASMLVNLAAFPAATVATVAVWSGCLLSMLPAPLDALSAPSRWAAGFIARSLIAVCARASAQPWAAVEVPAPGPGALLVYGLAAGALFALPDRGRARTLAGAALCSAAWLGAAVAAAPPRLSVTMLEGRRGGAAVAVLPDGRRLILGDGVGPAVLRAALRRLGPGGAKRHPGPARLSLGGVSLVWRPEGLVAALRGKEVYCVRSGPPSKKPLPCPASATVETRRTGAVELFTDGRQIALVFLERGVDRGPVP